MVISIRLRASEELFQLPLNSLFVYLVEEQVKIEPSKEEPNYISTDLEWHRYRTFL